MRPAMHPFRYERPGTLAEAIAILDRLGPQAQIIAGGTDLVIGLRDRSIQPEVVLDLKGIEELGPRIGMVDGRLSISAGTVMSDIEADATIAEHFPALAEAAAVVGSVQIRNRATLAGNI
jgi:CO/xanthine dehydrogenase FAD-binding subunit